MAFRIVAALFFASVAAADFAPGDTSACDWWYENTKHTAAWHNAKDFGAVGDGVHDDTAAIQAAFDFQQTGGDGSHLAKSPAIVYLPPGTYLISDTIVMWFWNHLVGNPLCPPTLLLAPSSPGYNASGGLLKPVVAAVCGFSMNASYHAWWVVGKYQGGNANDLFYVHIRDVNIVVSGGNAGAVGILWNVAQQTSIRGVTIDLTASGAIGIDEGGNDYIQAWEPSLNYGGGGVIDNVTIRGGAVGMRVAASQFTYRAVTITNATQACVNATMVWAMTFIGLQASHCPVAVTYAPAVGNLVLLDSVLGPGLGPAAVDNSGASGLHLQNVQVLGANTTEVVQGLLPTDGSGNYTVPAWVAATTYINGVAQAAGAGGTYSSFLPLPSAANASAQGIRLACNGGSNLCGGSAEMPHTGIPDRPRPTFAAGTNPVTGDAFVNVLDYGAVGDGQHDDTAAIRAALAASTAVFFPFGTFGVSDTITLPCNVTLLGEGLSTLALLPASPGFGNNQSWKAMLATASDPTCTVLMADFSLSTLGDGNAGALLLDWQAGPNCGLWDVTVRLYWKVGLKARFGRPAATAGSQALAPSSSSSAAGPGIGGGFISNAWFWAADHNLTDLYQMNCTDTANTTCTDHMPPNTPLGLHITTDGPLFLTGTNMEHSLVTEYHLIGASNVILAHMQTEATPGAVVIEDPSLVTVFAGLYCVWHTPGVYALMQTNRSAGDGNCVAAHTSNGIRMHGLAAPAASSQAAEPSASAPASALGLGLHAPITTLDVSYRIHGYLQRGSQWALVDSEYSIAGNATSWAPAAAVLNTC